MKRGISIAAVTATITIMIILISVVTISGSNMSANNKRSNFALEIYSIQQAVDSYLQNNPGNYPILSSVIIDLSNVSNENKLQFTNNKDVITDNKISLFEIDFDKIGYTNLKYGNKEDGENDVYLLSALTGKVYYAKGFIVRDEVYYTLTPKLEKILEYKTTDSITSNNREVILYRQENLENSQKKVTIKIPISYNVTSIKVKDYEYSVVNSNSEYNIYEITGMPGTLIDISYVYNGETVTTQYNINATDEKTTEGYVKDGLLVYLDGINNTGNGYSSDANIWKDLSGNGNNGKLSNIGTTKTSGWNGNYLTLDGIDDFVNLGLVNYDFSNGITMSIIVRFNEKTYQEFFDNYAGAGCGIGTYAGEKITCNLYIKELSKYVGINSKNKVEYMKDYIIDVTYDGNTIKMYLDGKLENTVSCVGSIKPSPTSMLVGANPSQSDPSKADANFSKVSVKKVMIYNRGLTENEISQNYKMDKIRFGI